MAALLIVAHQPLAAALAAVARHLEVNTGAEIQFVDVTPPMGLDEVRALVGEAIDRLQPRPVLVLTDVHAATPCNGAAQAAAHRAGVRVVVGVNVPMLWKAVGHINDALDALVAAVVSAGRDGVQPL